ncbi:MAG: polyphosphate kinase 2, partial [Albidovulum sp.]
MTVRETASPALDWLEAELADTLDEDFEIELEDAVLSQEIKRIYRQHHPDTIDRRAYFTALIRLQSELIKLQDWVQHH